MNLALCAIFKNEAPYIVEWVAHHRLQGINKFFIANNESSDETEDVLKAMQDCGYLEYFNFSAPEGQAPQLHAYREIIKRYSSEADWMGFVDADEFICPSGVYEGRFADVIGEFDRLSNVGSVVLNWSVFGSSGDDFYTDGPLLKRFSKRALINFSENHHYKSFFRMAALSSVGANPHFFNISEGYDVVHIDGRSVVDHERGKGLSKEVVWSPFRINHYLLKSKEEFLKKKKPNGSAAVLGRKKGRDYFFHHDRNDENDPVSAQYLAIFSEEFRSICIATSLEHSVFLRAFDGEIDLDDLMKNTSLLDSCARVEGGWLFKGWSTIDIGREDAKLTIQFSDSFEIPFEFICVRRPDVFNKRLSAAEACGFSFKLPDAVFLSHGMPKKIVFRNQNSIATMVFEDNYSMEEWLKHLLQYEAAIANYVDLGLNLTSAYDVFDRSSLTECDSFDQLLLQKDGCVVFSTREVNAAPKIKVLASPSDLSATSPVFIPLPYKQAFPEVNLSPESVLYKLSDVEIYPDGIVKKGGKLFVESFRNGPARPHTGLAKWEDWAGGYDHVEDAVFYLGGEHFGAYGHFLGEVLSRLWVKRYIDINKFKILVDNKNISFVKELLRLAGVDERCLFDIKKPLKVDIAFFASQSHVVRTGLSKEGAYFYRELAASSNVKINSKNIYLSRRMQRQRSLRNEKDVERIFRNLGFDIVFPELLTIESQIAIFDGCENIAGVSGSAFFTSLFGGRNKRKFIITNSAYILHNDAIMNSFNECDISYFVQKVEEKNGAHADWEIDLRQLEKCARQWALDFKGV